MRKVGRATSLCVTATCLVYIYTQRRDRLWHCGSMLWPCKVRESLLALLGTMWPRLAGDESEGSKRKCKVREWENGKDDLGHGERNRRRALAFEGASVELPPVILALHYYATILPLTSVSTHFHRPKKSTLREYIWSPLEGVIYIPCRIG